jgi:chromosome segregation ATPase
VWPSLKRDPDKTSQQSKQSKDSNNDIKALKEQFAQFSQQQAQMMQQFSQLNQVVSVLNSRLNDFETNLDLIRKTQKSIQKDLSQQNYSKNDVNSLNRPIASLQTQYSSARNSFNQASQSLSNL